MSRRITRRDALAVAATGALTSAAGAAGTSDAPAVAPATPVVSRRISAAQFERWLQLRGGLEGPAWWYSEGLVRPIAEQGRPVARMLGVETWVTPGELRTATSAVSLSRKIYFHLELDRDEIVRDAVTGKPARPSIFIHQVRTFTLQDAAIRYDVESHNLTGITQGGRNSVYTVTEMADQMHVNYGTYPIRPQPDGSQRSTLGEIYDYWDNGPRVAELAARYQMSWVGANIEGRVQNMRGWRCASFDAVPNAWLRAMVRDKAPRWMAPPQSMAEIETLRRTLPYPVPGLGI